MMHGGPRNGAGRPKGARNKRQQAMVDALAVPAGVTPLAYMLRVMNDPAAPVQRRDKMALAAAPFLHSKLNPTGWLPTHNNSFGLDDEEQEDDAAKMVARLLREPADE